MGYFRAKPVRVATEHVLNGVDVLALLAGLRMIRTSATGISGVKINLVVPMYRLRSRDDPYVAVSNNFVPCSDFFAACFTWPNAGGARALVLLATRATLFVQIQEFLCRMPFLCKAPAVG